MEFGILYRIDIDEVDTGEWEEYLVLKVPSHAAFIAKCLGESDMNNFYGWVDETGKLYKL